ncbi:MAG: hypothetical protein U0797_31815 [Gemmataceae bacterium]
MRPSNILNPGGFVQATVGGFWRDGIELCRVVAFEETAFAGGQATAISMMRSLP